jgi:hypothetical protein
MTFSIEADLFYRRAFALRHSLKVFGQDPWSRLLRFNYRDLAWSIHQGQYLDLLEARKDLAGLCAFIEQYRPDAFYGTVSHLLLLAGLLQGKPLAAPIKFVVTRSEYLSDENRRYLERTFKCPVFNIYASREFGPLAQECPEQQGFHVNEDRFLVEITDESGRGIKDGAPGKIVVTSFDNKLMPFIRYEIGVPYDDLREVARRAGVEGKTPETLALRRLMPFREEILAWTYRQIIQRCREQGILPVLVFLPQVTEGSWQEETPAILRIAKEAGFMVLDLSDVYRGQDLVSIRMADWDNHPNAKGHSLIAGRLFEALQANAESLFPHGSAQAKGHVATAKPVL